MDHRPLPIGRRCIRPFGHDSGPIAAGGEIETQHPFGEVQVRAVLTGQRQRRAYRALWIEEPAWRSYTPTKCWGGRKGGKRRRTSSLERTSWARP